MADTIAKIMIVLGPVFVLIGAFIFLYRHREQWQQEIKELQEPKGESFTIKYAHDDNMPAQIQARADELGITPEELIKQLVEGCLHDTQ